jgi:hypothetical protein
MMKYTKSPFLGLELGFGLIALSLAGCSSVHKDYEYMSEPANQTKDRLEGGLVGQNQELNEAGIQKILANRVVLPRQVRLAVVRLPAPGENHGLSEINDETVSGFYQKNNWGPRIVSVIPTPELLLSKNPSISSLRQTAAYLQADAILVIKPMVRSDWKFMVFEKNKAIATSTLEVVLIDTRTGAVPYTTLVTEKASAVKSDQDFSEYEFELRAKKESETKAMLQVPQDVKTFLNSGAI